MLVLSAVILWLSVAACLAAQWASLYRRVVSGMQGPAISVGWGRVLSGCLQGLRAVGGALCNVAGAKSEAAG